VNEITNMFEEDFQIKLDIVNNLAKTDSRKVATIYIASWQMEPAIDYTKVEDTLKVLLIECTK